MSGLLRRFGTSAAPASREHGTCPPLQCTRPDPERDLPGRMTHYAHLSPYTYGTVPVGVDARNLGWLEPGMDFPQGEVPDRFLDELGVL